MKFCTHELDQLTVEFITMVKFVVDYLFESGIKLSHNEPSILLKSSVELEGV